MFSNILVYLCSSFSLLASVLVHFLYSWIVSGGDGTVKSHVTFRLAGEKWYSWQTNKREG